MIVVRAEIAKLRLTRSLWSVPVGGALFSLVTAALLISLVEPADLAGKLSEHGPLRFGPTNIGLVLLVFGIRLFGDETHHGTLASTYLAVPRRWRVVAAKAAVALGVAVAFCLVVLGSTAVVTLVGADVRGVSMTADLADVAALVARTSVAMGAMAVLGVLVAVIARNRTVVLVASLLWLALAENLVGSLTKAPELMPGSVIRSLVSGGTDALGAGASALALLAMVVAGSAVAFLRLDHDID